MTTDRRFPAGIQHHHQQCWICGNDNPRSLRLHFSPQADGSVSADLQGDPELQGYSGLMHGGSLASLLDAAMTHCLFHRNIEAVTGDLRIRYLRPVCCGDHMVITARLTLERSPVFRLGATIEVNGQLAVRGTATFMRRKGFSHE